MLPLAHLLTAATLTTAAPALLPAALWSPRRPPVAPVFGHELRDPFRWPAEPPGPSSEEIDPERFADAVGDLCRNPARRSLGTPVLVASAEAGVDPFLLAALMFEQSGCDRRLSTPAGYGLLRLHPAMYFQPDHPPVPVARADLDPGRLLQAHHSLRVGARLLAMWDARHAEIDARFRARTVGARHRSAVSHFVWGDIVWSSAAEDRILTARRRLLERYAGAPAPRRTRLGLDIVSPLEGIPRLGTSGIGEDRDGGARLHRGLDIAGVVGEPVRSIADGVVVFAGVDLPGSSSHETLAPRDGVRWSSSTVSGVGPGGLFVCIEHDGTPPVRVAGAHGQVTSCYFHLRRFVVRQDERVVAGEVIGEVGLSGVRTSPPHLHFELRIAEQVQNPVPVLGDLVIPPRETVAYRNAIKRQRDRLERNGASPLAPADGMEAPVRQRGHVGRGLADKRSRPARAKI